MTPAQETAALRDAKERATRIADKVVPKYRMGKGTYSCTSHTAQLWQAAWDGAIEAMGYANEQFKGLPPYFGESE